MNYNGTYRDKRRSLIDVNRKDRKLKKIILIDVHTIVIFNQYNKENQKMIKCKKL